MMKELGGNGWEMILGLVAGFILLAVFIWLIVKAVNKNK